MKRFKFNHFGIEGTKNIYNTKGKPHLNKIFEVANYIGIFTLKNKKVRNEKIRVVLYVLIFLHT